MILISKCPNQHSRNLVSTKLLFVVGKLGFFQSDSEFGHLHVQGGAETKLPHSCNLPADHLNKESKIASGALHFSSHYPQSSNAVHLHLWCFKHRMWTWFYSCNYDFQLLWAHRYQATSLEGVTLGDPFVIQRPCRQYTQSGEETKEEGEEQQVDVDGRSKWIRVKYMKLMKQSKSAWMETSSNRFELWFLWRIIPTWLLNLICQRFPLSRR